MGKQGRREGKDGVLRVVVGGYCRCRDGDDGGCWTSGRRVGRHQQRGWASWRLGGTSRQEVCSQSSEEGGRGCQSVKGALGEGFAWSFGQEGSTEAVGVGCENEGSCEQVPE